MNTLNSRATILGRAVPFLDRRDDSPAAHGPRDSDEDSHGEPEAPSIRPLTGKQQRFIDEYMIDMNAAAAARRAGYSKKTARLIGHENLTKPNIAAAIDEARSQLSQTSKATVEWIVAELMHIASANIQDYAEFASDGSIKLDMEAILRDLGGAVSDFVIEEVVIAPVGDGRPQRIKRHFTIRMSNKLAALQALGKHLGMFQNGR